MCIYECFMAWMDKLKTGSQNWIVTVTLDNGLTDKALNIKQTFFVTKKL